MRHGPRATFLGPFPVSRRPTNAITEPRLRRQHCGDRIHLSRRAVIRTELRKSLPLNIGNPVVVSNIQPKPRSVA